MTIKEYNTLAEGILGLLKEPIRVNEYDLTLTANIGISIYTDKELSVDSLRKHAKIALLKAKKEGKTLTDSIHLIWMSNILRRFPLEMDYMTLLKKSTSSILSAYS